jgi:hypothetical protein
VFDTADYELAWPRDLFVAEGTAILAREQAKARGWVQQAELLLTEAFAGPAPRDDFNSSGVRDIVAFVTQDPEANADQRSFLRALVDAAPRLREATEAAPYWRVRQRGNGPQAVFSEAERMARFATVIESDLLDAGYLERFLPKTCVDDQEPVVVDPSARLEKLIGTPNLWPLSQTVGTWDLDLFFDLVEVFHDFVARPRSRREHDFGGCGWHFSDLAIEPGRRLYRWRVNQLLAEASLSYRLADSGDDAGRLIAVTDEARADLAQRMIKRSDPSTEDRVRHAIALFRARTASREDKRAALKDLVDVLELRRALIRRNLLRRDEGDLFEIANSFDVRHMNERQKREYDDAFLDWLFWWYLATIELTDRLVVRERQLAS